MQNPFAIAVQWPDNPRRYLVHLQRPYFTAALVEAAAGTWLLANWAPGSERCDNVLRAAAAFCRAELQLDDAPISFVERQFDHALPRYLMARSEPHGLFIVEPEHGAPLVEVREKTVESSSPKKDQRFDVVTAFRLAEMRKYYREYLERQQRLAPTPTTVLV
jgi:hypothetical protein